MKKKNILVFGGSGMLGTRIRELLSNKYNISSPSRKEVDITNRNAVEKFLDATSYNAVVYAAGETTQVGAGKNSEYAMQINFKSAEHVAKCLKKMNVPLVYISTDAVFNGIKKESPYKETDYVNPINFYGETKARGESAVLSASNENVVLRLITLYSANYERKTDFARKTIKNLIENTKFYGISDQYFNPTFSDDAVNGLSAVLDKKITGILHLGSTDYLTNFDFCVILAKKFGYGEQLIISISVEKFFKNEKIKRGKFCWLDTKKAQKLLGKNILHTNAKNIDNFFNQYENN